MKEQKVTELVNTYNIPASVARQCVSDAGFVDQEKVALVVGTVKAMKDGLTARDLAEIETLKGDLKEIQAAMKQPGANVMLLAQRSINLKQEIYSRGGRP